MVTLTNKRNLYSVANNNQELKISGNLTITADNRIVDFGGQFLSQEDSYLGSFYYNESEAGKANKNLSDVGIDIQADACEFLDETINEIKSVNENDN